MKTFQNGDLIRLSLRGRLSIGEIDHPDKIGVVLCNDLLHDDLYFVKWLSTGVSGEVHADFIEKLEEK